MPVGGSGALKILGFGGVDGGEGVQLIDFNGDGHLDMAVTQMISSRLVVFQGGSYSLATTGTLTVNGPEYVGVFGDGGTITQSAGSWMGLPQSCFSKIWYVPSASPVRTVLVRSSAPPSAPAGDFVSRTRTGTLFITPTEATPIPPG